MRSVVVGQSGCGALPMPERDAIPQSDQLAEAGRDEPLLGNGAGRSRLASMEASPPTLLPAGDAGQYGPARKWFAPLVGLMVLTFVGWLAMGRMGQEFGGPAIHNAPFKGMDTSQTPVGPIPSAAPTAPPPSVAPLSGPVASTG